MPTTALPSGLSLRRTVPAEGGRIRGLAWSPDGRRLAAVGSDPALRIWELDGQGPPIVLGSGIPGWCAAWSPDGRAIAAGSTLDAAIVWDVEGRRETARLEHRGGVSTVLFARDGNSLLAGGRDGRITVWDVPSGARRAMLRGHRKAVTDLAWRPGSDALASASVDRTVRLWDLRGAAEIFALRGHEGAVLALSWSPDAGYLASAGADSSIRLWDCGKRSEARRLAGHTAAVVSVRFSPGGDLLVSKALDGTVRLWSAADWQTVAVLEEPADDRTPFGTAVLNPRLPVLATLGAHDTAVRLWDLDVDTLLSSPATAAVELSHPFLSGDRDEAGALVAQKRESGTFDVFLCHNTADKPAVRRIGECLVELGLLPWLDEWELRPGFPWQEALEEQIRSIGAAAVFVGPHSLGPWQDLEQKAFLRRFVERRCPVIPVLLPGCSDPPELPSFLGGMTWVDLRRADPNPLEQLIWGITGRRPRQNGDLISRRLAALSVPDLLAEIAAAALG